ncbi:hypothetical protein [Rhizobium leguminosarum]|uniref:hypothetical protein n=1 Tax=Rhizobium leguminosarum TaxID=384 RepID=UPI003F964E2C
MSNVKKGILAASQEHGKHLRPEEKRIFWKRHRKMEAIETQSNAGLKMSVRKTFSRLGRND